MREPSRRGREKGERDVSPRQENGGVPARTLNLLNALARAWNASISLFYFGPFSFVARSLPFLQFRPFYSRLPSDRTSEPTGGRNPFSPRVLVPVRADLMTLPPTIWRWFNCLRPTEMKHLQVELFHRAGLLFSIGRSTFQNDRSIGLTQPGTGNTNELLSD